MPPKMPGDRRALIDLPVTFLPRLRLYISLCY